ncbi:secreted RxLR effector protein 161-like [Aristolochia californica]|uniref:secreted RxLR effector protein 161-like n=1 Tax=Aristolochia californica TaxID=171875 RepID=UPI0035DD60CA
MMLEFDMTGFGKMRYFIGIEVMQRSDDIFISKKKYVQEVLDRFNMDKCNPVFYPMVPGFKLIKNRDGVKIDSTFYKQIVGSLMYLISTCPNIMFVVSLINRFMDCPTELHFQVAKRILRYLKGTIDFGVFYKKEESEELIAFTDSDYDEELDERKNTSGYVLMLLGSGVVSWSSKKQPIVALSTTKAEFIVAISCAY